VKNVGKFSEWWEGIRERQQAAILMGKQAQVDKINAKNFAAGKDFEVYIDDRGKLQKRKRGSDD
jgi:hypothetical protein